MKTLTLAPNLIQTKQAEAIKNQTLRKDCQLGDIKLVSETHVEIGGHMIKITKNAYRSLIKTMGLPSTFTSRLDRLFNKDCAQSELFVKIVGFSSGTTPYLSIYFSKEDANITPGKSLFLKEINLSI